MIYEAIVVEKESAVCGERVVIGPEMVSGRDEYAARDRFLVEHAQDVLSYGLQNVYVLIRPWFSRAL